MHASHHHSIRPGYVHIAVGLPSITTMLQWSSTAGVGRNPDVRAEVTEHDAQAITEVMPSLEMHSDATPCLGKLGSLFQHGSVRRGARDGHVSQRSLHAVHDLLLPSRAEED